MRLRRPCEHGLYDDHSVYVTGFPAVDCPGGEFLPEDAVVLSDASDTDLQEEWVRRVTKGSGEGTVRISYIGPDQPPVYIDVDLYRHWGEDA